jgi:hypothetical protein
MATAIPFPMVKSIHGRLGNFVFYFRPGQQCIRTHVVPYNPDTEAQRIVRRAFGDAVRSWQSMSDDEKNTYNRKARFLDMSGYNLYISEYMKTYISVKSLNPATSGSSDSAISSPSTNSLTSVSKPKSKAPGLNPDAGTSKLSPD